MKPITTTTKQTDEMVKVKCHLCSFEWDYKGERMMATCPNCNRKTAVKKTPDRQNRKSNAVGE